MLLLMKHVHHNLHGYCAIKQIFAGNHPLINYQEHVEIPFEHSESTRSLEKDRYMNKNNKIN